MTLLEFFQENTGFFIACIFILGLLVGSFLNVVIYRLPIMLERSWRAQAREILALEAVEETPKRFNLVLPDSCCPNCQRKIKAWENIPLVSWLCLKGRCAGCKQPISMRYPIVELLTGCFSAFIAYQFGVTWLMAAMLFLTWGLLAMSLIDIDHQILPDNLTLPLVWLGLIVNSFGLITDLSTAVYGAIFGYLSLWSVYWAFKLLTGKEGMGYGDFKLLALIGAWGGWQVLPLTILLSSLVGAVLGIIILRLQNKGVMSNPLPFGPYLAIAGWIALIWGNEVLQFYYNISGMS